MGQLTFAYDAQGRLASATPSGEMPADRSAAALQDLATEAAALRALFTATLQELTATLSKAAANPPATVADLQGFQKNVAGAFDRAAAPIVARLEQAEQERARREYRALYQERATVELRKRGAMFGVQAVEIAWSGDTTMEATCRNALGGIVPLRYLVTDGKLTL